MNNQQIGSRFEKDFARFLANQGYWVHLIERSAHSGSQPFDLIAIKNDIPHCIDCKTLANKGGRFPTSRIEDNQILAYKRFKKCGNTNFDLAILWNNDVYLIPFDCIDFKEKSIPLADNCPEWRNFYENQN